MKPKNIDELFDQIQIDADNGVIYNKKLYCEECYRIFNEEKRKNHLMISGVEALAELSKAVRNPFFISWKRSTLTYQVYFGINNPKKFESDDLAEAIKQAVIYYGRAEGLITDELINKIEANEQTETPSGNSGADEGSSDR